MPKLTLILDDKRKPLGLPDKEANLVEDATVNITCFLAEMQNLGYEVEFQTTKEKVKLSFNK